MMDKTWNSKTPQNCDVCGNKIDNEFYDAKTRIGPWAITCDKCWKMVGVFGQHYRLYEDGQFYKTRNVRKAT